MSVLFFNGKKASACVPCCDVTYIFLQEDNSPAFIQVGLRDNTPMSVPYETLEKATDEFKHASEELQYYYNSLNKKEM